MLNIIIYLTCNKITFPCVTLVIDNCLGVQCLNNATCANSLNAFTCQCVSGYTGALCESGIVLKDRNSFLYFKFRNDQDYCT